jgi:phosphate transport system substrate-binding protein
MGRARHDRSSLVQVTRLGGVLTLVATGALALGACGSSSKSSTGSSTPSTASGTAGGAVTCASGKISGAGSTFQKNIELQWIADFKSKCGGETVDYQGTGSGAGIQSFINNTIDFAGSDSLMKTDEQASADKRCGAGNKAIHIPVTAGAVVFTYNVTGVQGLQLSAKVVADIYQGKVKKWNDAEVKADNPTASLPDLAIQPVHRSDSSGTTDILSKFLTSQARSDWTLGTGKTINFPGGQAASGSDGVTNLVKSTSGAITYTELSFAMANSLTPAKVKNASGAYVDPNGDAVAATLGTAKVDSSKGDVRVSIDYGTTEAKAYPVSAVTYVIACDKGNKNASALKAYLTYATGAGQATAGALGYAPLPSVLSAPVATEVSSLA